MARALRATVATLDGLFATAQARARLKLEKATVSPSPRLLTSSPPAPLTAPPWREK